MLQINADRLWQSLMDLARIGATEKGGVRRLTLSDEDRRGRDRFVQWCREANLAIEIDGIGNIFARRPGTDPALPPVAIGNWAFDTGRRSCYLIWSVALAALLAPTLNLKGAHVSNDRTLNEVANNGPLSLFAAIWTNNLDYAAFYKTMPRNEAYQRARRRKCRPLPRLRHQRGFFPRRHQDALGLGERTRQPQRAGIPGAGRRRGLEAGL